MTLLVLRSLNVDTKSTARCWANAASCSFPVRRSHALRQTCTVSGDSPELGAVAAGRSVRKWYRRNRGSDRIADSSRAKVCRNWSDSASGGSLPGKHQHGHERSEMAADSGMDSLGQAAATVPINMVCFESQ